MSLTNKTHHRKLSHKKAVELVYQLTPQIKDYDRFMHVGARWLPYTMYFHEKNFRSNTINTDSLGFRYTYLNNNRYSVAEIPEGSIINLLVGGSTALGVGATSDKTTLASYLSQKTNEIWLNFAGRGYNAVQELIMFLIHQPKFYRIGKVIVLSGINTLALEGIPDHLASDNGRYYYSYEFQHYMNKYNEDMKRKKDSFSIEYNNSLSYIQKLKSRFKNLNPADIIITDENVELETRVIRAANVITDTLYQWKLLLSDFTIDMRFILQPLAYWTRDYLTTAEKSVFHAIDHCPNNFYRLFSGVLGKEVHSLFFNNIQKNADRHKILCYDMNLLLANSQKLTETLFVDRVHFNDLGNEVLADIILTEIIT